MHPVLERQIAKCGVNRDSIPPEIKQLLELVSASYTNADTDRSMIERSLELTSQEMGELNRKLSFERDQAQAIISSIGDGLLVVDEEARILLINDVARKMLHITNEDPLGQKWSKFVVALKGTEPLKDEDRSFFMTIKEGKTIDTRIEDDHWYQTQDNTRFPVAAVTSPLLSGNKIVGAVKVFRDVTHEKKATEGIESLVTERTKELNDKNLSLKKAQEQITSGWLELQDQKARLSTSINNLPLGFLLFDTGENVLLQNPPTKDILSLTADIFTFNQLSGLLKAHIDLHAVLDECKKDKKFKEIREVLYNNNKYLHIYVIPILGLVDKEERYIGSSVLIEDITDAKILERSKDEFFSIASHELRTPLTAIRGNTSMIKDYFHAEIKDQNLKELIDDIHESSVRLIGIVNDFLDLSRLEQKKLQFKIEKVDVLEVSRQIEEELKPTVHEGVTLEVITPSQPLPAMKADLNKVKEVIINLVGNSLKFTEQGRVIISFEALNNHVQVNITDTGRGIPVTTQNLLFRKFQQAGEDILTRDTTKGTGLGLYISKLMVEGMGGTIKLVRSEPGKGSTFAFSLPAW